MATARSVSRRRGLSTGRYFEHSRDGKGLEGKGEARKGLNLSPLHRKGASASDGKAGETAADAAPDSLGVVGTLVVCVGVLLRDGEKSGIGSHDGGEHDISSWLQT